MKKLIFFILVSVGGYYAYHALVLKPLSNQAAADLGLLSPAKKSKHGNAILDAIVPSENTVAKAAGKPAAPDADGEKTDAADAPPDKAAAPLPGGQVGVTQYRGKGFPAQSDYLIPPANHGAGLLTIDNGYSGSNLLVEFKQNNAVVAAAFVKNGERFSAKGLPAGTYLLQLQDLHNSQITTTRGFDALAQVKVTPYPSGQGTGSILLYRAEAQAKH